MKDDVFIDPSAVTPRQLNKIEMSNLEGGLLPVMFAVACGGSLVAGIAMGIATVGMD